MKIWLYTTTYNEAKILPFFLRHYEQFCDRITVFDDKSTDGTQDIVRGCPKAVLEPYPYKSGLDDRDFIQLASETYKRARGQADWVIWVDPDEFLFAGKHSTFNIQHSTSKVENGVVEVLERLRAEGVQVPLTRGFQMISEKFPWFGADGKQIWEIVDEGVEDPIYAKPCVFRPECELQWDPGKHYVHGNFNRGSYAGLKVLHYRCLGLEYLRERHQRNYARCSKANLDSGLGVGVYPGHQGHMSEPWFAAVAPTRRPVLNNSTFHELVRVIHEGQDPYAEARRGAAGGAGTSGVGARSVSGEAPATAREARALPGFQPTWGSEHPWLHETIERVRPQVVIEVGTFLGRSAAHMGEKLKAMGLDSAIICVDTFLGDDEHWTIPEVRKLMGSFAGRPLLYPKFLGNMEACGLAKYVVPLPLDSISGARLLARLGVKSDMIYIDGGHVEGEVYRDLVNFWSLLRPGGALLADDYGDARFPGLQRDVDRFSVDGLRKEFNGNKARLWKR